ncbi:MAG: ScyD/ScyE family protein [Christiangramia sp.]
MKTFSFKAFLCLLVMSLIGCTSDPVSPEVPTDYESAIQKGPGVLKAKIKDGEFASPLFDLGTAPNGDILVADAGAGISNIYGFTEISLPGVTSVGPIGRGSMWATTGPSSDTEEDTGQALYRVSKGKNRLIANLFAFEEANDPDGAGVDSNPYSVASLGGNSALVVDSGANDLLRVNNQGNIELVAVFPDELVSTTNFQQLTGCPALDCAPPMLPAQAVPTSVVVGPDGYYYVSELKGFPAPTNASNIWRIAPNASGAMCGSSPDCVKMFDGGFTSIIDIAFGDDGMLYVAELDEQSWFAVEVLGGGVGGTINRCDPETLICEEIATGIPILTAIAFGKKGSLWATKNALIPGLAEVIEVP